MGWIEETLAAIFIAIFAFVLGKSWERDQWQMGRREKEIQDLLEERLYRLRRD